MPIIEEAHDIADENKLCSVCTKPYTLLSRTENSDVVEIKVKGLNILKQLKDAPRLNIQPENNQLPSPMEQQGDAIKQSLDWTMTEFSYRLNQ